MKRTIRKSTGQNKQHRIKFEKYCSRVINELISKFNLGEYQWTIKFTPELHMRSGRSMAAQVEIDCTYLRATMEITDETYEYYKQKRADLVIDVFAHELAHLLVEPLFDFALDYVSPHTRSFLDEIDERQTQRITNVIVKLLPKTLYAIK